ncbi:sigma-54 interaction domain-containing protein [Marinomonas posidonica]|uniref:Sigma54 specific transcriptional regulator, Fis family n=1 Tax=Marinomonas posidonica (strain CECT 7376 / NCIMB 14433 / IVIA-Po-181) TaxID=491952 RepID=F6CWV4_MARPP|nr:sigma 54-interacting transcriptional regulator [Marinomonas posidonica]AEF55516.1 sigma54 specific transcriptional regulator, Fis family [Marinomonas posidonica IVIA-Po-181]
MAGWLEDASTLLTYKNSREFFHSLSQLILKKNSLRGVYLLEISSDGRFFKYKNGNQETVWDVSDFDCVLAHAIQKNDTLSIEGEDLNFWVSDGSLFELLKPCDKERIIFYPLKMSGNKTEYFYVLHGDIACFEMIDKDDFQEFMKVCNAYLTAIVESERKDLLRISLSDKANEDKKKLTLKKGLDDLSNVIAGHSSVMKKLREQISRAAFSNLTVMVLGETGVGKELVSRAVHDLSERKNNPFVAINCAAIPDSLLESELFGYVKGAFSGANQDKKGLIENAHQGTLFLDEIGDMPHNLQAKVLRVIETKKYRPVGSKKEYESDFRLVVATHVNLRDKVNSNDFRKDLFYRLYQYPIKIPPLRERTGDIKYLSEYFVRQFNSHHDKDVKGIEVEACDALSNYDFPGNVRELKHLIQYGCEQADNRGYINKEMIVSRLDEMSFMNEEEVGEEINSFNIEASDLDVTDLKEAVKEFESKILYRTLKKYNGNRSMAAKSLGIPKRTLADKCLKLEISL